MNTGRRLADMSAIRTNEDGVWATRGASIFPMAVKQRVEAVHDRLEVVESVRPRLVDVAAPADVEQLIEDALADLWPANVTTYLPILVERRVRDAVRHRADEPPA